MDTKNSFQIFGESTDCISEIHNYCGSPVSFKLKDELMVNASQMAKPFWKLPADFIRLQSTDDYIQALCIRYGNSHSDILQVVNGGNNPGTWMHQKLALRFAQWLSPKFAVWVDERIEELITGRTALPAFQSQIPKSYSAALRLAAEQAEKIEEQQRLMEEAKPKVEAYHELMTCANAISMKELAGVLAVSGMGRTNLFKYLKGRKVLTLTNKPYQYYINRGWFKLKESTWRNPKTGKTRVETTTVVMQAGVDGIRRMLRKEGY